MKNILILIIKGGLFTIGVFISLYVIIGLFPLLVHFLAPPVMKLIMGERDYILWVIQNDKKEFPLFPILAGELCNVSNDIKSDRKIAELSIKKDVRSIRCISSELRKDKYFAVLAIKSTNERNALEYLDPTFQDDKEIVIMSLDHNLSLSSLQYASQRLRDDKEIALLACSKEKSYTLEYVSLRLSNDKDVVIKCLENQEWNGFRKISSLLLKDREVMLAAIRNNPSYISLTPLKHNDDFVLEALKINIEVYNHLPDSQKNEEDIKR